MFSSYSSNDEFVFEANMDHYASREKEPKLGPGCPFKPQEHGQDFYNIHDQVTDFHHSPVDSYYLCRVND